MARFAFCLDSMLSKLSPVRDGKKSKLSGVLDSTETMLSAVQECNLSKLSTVRYTVELSSVLDKAESSSALSGTVLRQS